MFRIRMPYYEMPAEIGSESPSVVAEAEASDGGNAPSLTDDPETTSEDVTKQQSFAQRLKESTEKERAKLEAELAEKYKGYEDYKFIADYLQEAHKTDLMTLKERIEMERLQDRAAETGISPELQKRLETLEQKAAKADELEAQQKQRQEWIEFENSLKTFADGKELDGNPLDYMELWKFMSENGVSKPEVAYKAMKADILEAKLETAKKEGVKEFLASKGSIPTVPSSTTKGQVTNPAPKTFAEARQRAMQRMTQE